MGLLGAAGGIGTIIGPAVGGFLAATSLSLPFFIAAGLALLSLILAVIFLPESYPVREQKEKEAIIDWRAWWQALFSPIGTLFILTFISTCGLMVFFSVFGLYGMERFDYGPEKVGIIMMVLGLVSALTQGLLAGPATKHWGDERVIKIGLLATALSFGLLLLANTFVTVLLTTAFLALAVSIPSPALLSLTSRRATVPQGIAMGLSNSFVSLGRIVGPILGGAVLDIHLSLPYISGAAIMFVGFLASLVWSPQGGRETADTGLQATDE
jgi:DHA1 family multidrug resistance protein-like MFS transporter